MLEPTKTVDINSDVTSFASRASDETPQVSTDLQINSQTNKVSHFKQNENITLETNIIVNVDFNDRKSRMNTIESAAPVNEMTSIESDANGQDLNSTENMLLLTNKNNKSAKHDFDENFGKAAPKPDDLQTLAARNDIGYNIALDDQQKRILQFKTEQFDRHPTENSDLTNSFNFNPNLGQKETNNVTKTEKLKSTVFNTEQSNDNKSKSWPEEIKTMIEEVAEWLTKITGDVYL